MPAPTPPARERLQQLADQWSRRARVQSERARALLRAARTAEGRRRNVLALMAICGAAGALLGLALGWRSQRRD